MRNLAALLVLVSFTWAEAQEINYIEKRSVYKTNLTSINFSPDGNLLLAGFHDGSFRLLDPVSFETKLEVNDAHPKAVNAMEMPPKMDFILTAGHNSIKLWDLNGNHVGNWTAHATTIWNVDISSDGKHAVSSAFNKTFLLWDVYNSVVLEKMQGHKDITLSVSISPDNRWIASGGKDLSIQLWDLGSRQIKSQFHGPTEEIYDLEFSPDGTLLAAASKDRSIRLYNLAEEELVHLLKGHRDMVLEVAFSPDGRYLISGSADQAIILWDIHSGEKIHAFLDNDEAVLDLIFHPAGESFYSISFAGDLTRWKLDPEIFVNCYYHNAYQAELKENPIFEDRRKGESKKLFLEREAEALIQKKRIIEKYYQKYLAEYPPQTKL